MWNTSPRLRAEYLRFLRVRLAGHFSADAPPAKAFSSLGAYDAEWAATFDPGAILQISEEYGGHPLQIAVERLAARLNAGLDIYKVPQKFEFFAGIFPTHSFNAQAVAIEDGYLFLLNEGMMMFVYEFSKLMSYRIAPVKQGEKVDCTFAAILDDTDHGLNVEEWIARLILTYLDGQAKWLMHFGRVPFHSETRTALAVSIGTAAELFALAHEYGHGLLGHLRSPERITGSGGSDEVPFIKKSWNDEYAADMAGCYFINYGLPSTFDTEEEFLFVQLTLAGPILFFCIADLIETVASNLSVIDTVELIGDHPPSSNRQDMMRHHLIQLGPITKLGDTIAQWVESVKPGILRHAKLLHESAA